MPERLFHSLAVLSAADETERLRALVLDGRAGGPGEAVAASYRVPGQYVVVRGGGAAGEEGSFALASRPGSGELELLVDARGGVAEAMRARAPGTRLDVSAAEGRGFALDGTWGRSLALLAMRTGIAALRAVIAEHLATPGRWPRVRLYWGAREEADFPYRDEWPVWERGGVELVRVLSGAAEEWTGERGHVQDVLERHGERGLGGPAAEAVALLAGSRPMVEQARAALRRLGVGPERVLTNF